MVDQSKIGTDWQPDELDAIVEDYFAMLREELVGRNVVKAHHARALDERIGRGHKSIEFKHMNISAVLAELGMPRIRGYRPKPNYQRAIFPALERYLDRHPETWLLGQDHVAKIAREASAPPPGMASSARPYEPSTEIGGDNLQQEIVVEDPPPPGAPRPPRPEGLQRLVRKFDPVARDFRNRTLGKAGEALVVDFERRRLAELERKDLAAKVRWVAQEDGDGAGYDIHSFDRDGNDRLIEVKTTRGGRSTPFFLTRNELALSEERPEHFRLFRLYEVAQAPRLFRLKPPIAEAVTLEPETWRARVG